MGFSNEVNLGHISFIGMWHRAELAKFPHPYKPGGLNGSMQHLLKVFL
jgi:hypothetical protein